MKEIYRIHLAKIPYEIEVDAKKELTKYFDDLRKYANDESIFNDVEIRVTEILKDFGVSRDGIISLDDVKKIKSQLGDPEVFAESDIDSKDLVSAQDINEESAKTTTKKKLYRDQANGMVAGIASGLSEYLSIDIVFVRILMLIFIPLTFGWFIPVYLILWILIPKVKTASDILRLRGEKASAQSIKNVNNEYDFSLLERKNNSVKKFFAILLGVISIFAAVGGLVLTFGVNLAFVGQANESVYSKSYEGLPMALFSAAGLLFVAFWILLAYISFTRKVKTQQIISFAVIIFLGISSFASGFYALGAAETNWDAKIQASIKKRAVKIDSDKLAKISTLDINSNIDVEYIVSDERKVEIVESDYLDDEKTNVEMNFDKETLNVAVSKENFYYGNFEKLLIYGPELKDITDTSSKQIKYTSKDQDSLLVVQKGYGSEVKLSNSATIKNLSIKQTEGSSFDGEYVAVDNLTIDASDGGSSIKLRSANVAKISASEICYREYGEGDPYEETSISLKYGDASKITVNEKTITVGVDIPCLDLTIDRPIN